MRKSFFRLLLPFTICILLSTGCANNQTESASAASFDAASSQYERSSDLIESGASDGEVLNPVNSYDILSVPTYITKIKDLYFIVDCYHNEVVFNENLTDPINEWSVMTSDIEMGHTIASDGVVYLIDDTERHRVLIMEETTDNNGATQFIPTQEFNDIGTRPHYIIYNEDTDTFYVLSSMTGELYLFRRDHKDNRVYLTDTLSIPALNGFYVRSFTIMDDSIFFVSGNANIIEAKLTDLSVINRYPVPFEMYGMVQLEKIEDYYYITVSTDGNGSQDAATIVRTKDLNKLIDGEFEDIYSNFVGGGTPYAITKIDDDYYLCEHRLPGHHIWRFNVKDNEILSPETLY